MPAATTEQPYIVTFERVGRSHDVPPLAVTERPSPDLIAYHIYNYVRPRLRSRDVEVVVNLDAMRGMIYCGFHNGGTFTLEHA